MFSGFIMDTGEYGMIREAAAGDAGQICGIYNHYVENTVITFEEKPVPAAEMEKRIRDISAVFPWLVYEENGSIIGYAYAVKWKTRAAYRFSAESTVYLKNCSLGKGVGSELYRRLIEELKEREVHAVMAGIALPNEKSRKLHEKFGFVKVAHFSEVGYKFGKWIDVGYWELKLPFGEISGHING